MSSFLYDPNSNYGYKAIAGPWGKAKNYLETYMGGLDAELNPEAYFTGMLAKQGYGGLDARSTLARNTYGRVQDAYGAARLKNNELTWKQFLDPFNFGELINSMTAREKGVNYSDTVPYDIRWLPRS